MKKSVRADRARSEKEVTLAVITKEKGGRTEMTKLSANAKRNKADKIFIQTLPNSLFTDIPPQEIICFHIE